MTRIEAEAVAKARYDALTAARIEHLFRGAPAPDEAAAGFRHGWMIVEGYSFPTCVWYPDNQPYSD